MLNESAKSGNYGTSVVGNENTITNNHFNGEFPKVLKRTVIFEICKVIAEYDINYDDDYSIQSNSDWMGKFEYNDVDVYVEIFDNYSDSYNDISDVLRGYVKKSMMVKKIRTVYLQADKIRIEKELDGDFLLGEVFRVLKEEVVYSSVSSESDLYDEEVDAAIYLIMFYAFTKCKLLKPVPKSDVHADN